MWLYSPQAGVYVQRALIVLEKTERAYKKMRLLSKGGVTLVNLQRQLAMIWCCAKNSSSVTPRWGRFFAIFTVLQRVGSFWKRFKSVSCLQVRAKNLRCESALQVDQCNITLKQFYEGYGKMSPRGATYQTLLLYVKRFRMMHILDTS